MSSPLPVEPQIYTLAAILGLALVAVIGVGAWLVFWRATSSAIARMHAELQRQQGLAAAGESELRRLDALVRQLEDRLVSDTRYGALAPRARSTGYEMAIRMAASGATDAELVAACGMSRDEAALVSRLHGQRTRSVA
ncbi:MAG: DUF2802 domain-containing protein [Gammaproteobacteria bacterium]